MTFFTISSASASERAAWPRASRRTASSGPTRSGRSRSAIWCGTSPVTERYVWAETVHNRPTRYVNHGRDLADGKDAVLAFLDRMHEESIAQFSALTPEMLTGKCVTPEGTPLTTWKWLRMMPEHEIHHRGQIYTMLGMLDVPTPPLYGMTAA